MKASYLFVRVPSKSSGKFAHGLVGFVTIGDLDHEAKDGKTVAEAETGDEVDVGSVVDEMDLGEGVVSIDGVFGATLASLVTPVEVERVELGERVMLLKRMVFEYLVFVADVSTRKLSVVVVRSEDDGVLVVSKVPGSLLVVAGHIPVLSAVHEVEVSVCVVQVDGRPADLVGALVSPGGAIDSEGLGVFPGGGEGGGGN